MQWDIVEQKNVLKTVPFIVEELRLRDKRKDELLHPYHRLLCSDWVNIFALTAQNEAILIRQTRAGSLQNELETPGGMVDPNEHDVTMAAARELEEETGFTSKRILPLASINPNPALFKNKLHMFLALNCERPSQRKHFPDQGELISVELFSLEKLDPMIRHGEINSCLCALTIMLAQRYLLK